MPCAELMFGARSVRPGLGHFDPNPNPGGDAAARHAPAEPSALASVASESVDAAANADRHCAPAQASASAAPAAPLHRESRRGDDQSVCEDASMRAAGSDVSVALAAPAPVGPATDCLEESEKPIDDACCPSAPLPLPLPSTAGTVLWSECTHCAEDALYCAYCTVWWWCPAMG